MILLSPKYPKPPKCPLKCTHHTSKRPCIREFNRKNPLCSGFLHPPSWLRSHFWAILGLFYPSVALLTRWRSLYFVERPPITILTGPLSKFSAPRAALGHSVHPHKPPLPQSLLWPHLWKLQPGNVLTSRFRSMFKWDGCIFCIEARFQVMKNMANWCEWLKSHHLSERRRLWNHSIRHPGDPPSPLVQSFPSPTPLLPNRWKSLPHWVTRPWHDHKREACHRCILSHRIHVWHIW